MDQLVPTPCRFTPWPNDLRRQRWYSRPTAKPEKPNWRVRPREMPCSRQLPVEHHRGMVFGTKNLVLGEKLLQTAKKSLSTSSKLQEILTVLVHREMLQVSKLLVDSSTIKLQVLGRSAHPLYLDEAKVLGLGVYWGQMNQHPRMENSRASGKLWLDGKLCRRGWVWFAVICPIIEMNHVQYKG